MRLLAIALAALLTGCATAPAPGTVANPDAASEPWYSATVQQLAGMNRDAEGLLARGKPDDAANLVTKGESLASRLLAVPRPTLAAMEAASDLDDLYGRMLLANRNYGWARLLFQKNEARWKNWRPQTQETARRLNLANAAIAECDRRMTE